MRKLSLALAFLLSLGIASASNFSIVDWERTIGSPLGDVIGNGQYCVGTYCLDMAPLLITIIVLGFIFLWSSVSGIAWDGIFFLLVMVIALLSQSFFGTTGMVIFGFIFSIVTMGIFYRILFRRG